MSDDNGTPRVAYLALTFREWSAFGLDPFSGLTLDLQFKGVGVGFAPVFATRAEAETYADGGAVMEVTLGASREPRPTGGER